MPIPQGILNSIPLLNPSLLKGNPYGSELLIQFEANPQYIPSADLYPGQGPVPPGTVNGYGTALWIPNGYPIATQPYLDVYGRVILRPLRKISVSSPNQLNVITAYIASALQVAVQKYSPAPYNVMNNTKMWSGPTVMQSYIQAQPGDHFAILTRTTMGSWDPDWANPKFPQATLLDAAFNAGKSFVLSTFTSGLSSIVPGLGALMSAEINKAANTGDISGMPAAIQNAAKQLESQASQQQQQQQPASQSQFPLTTEEMVIGAAIIVILIVWLS